MHMGGACGGFKGKGLSFFSFPLIHIPALMGRVGCRSHEWRSRLVEKLKWSTVWL